jgi:hypothetical protein
MKKLMALIALVSMASVLPGLANGFETEAPSIGVYCWQLAPYGDVVCFDLEKRSGFAVLYDASGWEHSAGNYKIPCSGAVVLDDYVGAYGAYVFEFECAYYPDILWQYGAYILTTTKSGEWFDNTGDSGDFVWLGPGPLSPDFEVKGIGPKLAK